jgi:acyl-CoA thioester hydrolase
MTERAAAIDLAPCEPTIDFTALDVPHPEPFVVSLTIGPHQLSDVIDHVSNIEYVRWLDRAAELHSDAAGYTRAWLLERGLLWFVARHEIDYLAECWLGDKLEIATWVRDMRRVKSWRDFIIARRGDGAVICRAATLWVLVDLATRRPARILNQMVERFRPLHVTPVRPVGTAAQRQAER